MPNDAPVIGVLSPLLAGAYFGEVVKGLSRHLCSAGGRLVAVQTLDGHLGDHFPGPPPFRTPVAWDRVDGFVVVTNAVGDEFLSELRDQGKPLLMISHEAQGLDCPRVMPDNRAGVQEAVAHLIGHGHTRIAFAGELARPDVARRYQSYLATMRENGLNVAPDMVFDVAGWSEDAGRQVAGSMLAARMPTAVMAGTDLTAKGILQAAREAGVGVPSELALVGFDDMGFAARLDPPLASVRQNLERLTGLAAQLIVDMARGRPVAGAEYLVKTTFVPRSSCGCARSAPAPLPAGPGEAPAERLRLNLSRSLCEPHAHPEQQEVVDLAVDEICLLFEQGLTGGPALPSRLAAATGALFEAFPYQETVQAVMECLQQYRRDLLHSRYSDERLQALDRCTGAVMRGLHSAEVSLLAGENESLQASLQHEYMVSLGMVGLRVGPAGLRREGVRPQSLEWLAGTEARAACLALWERDAPLEELVYLPLRVAGHYGPGLGDLLPLGTKVDIAAFPPEDLLRWPGAAPEDALFVLPVRTAERYWGILAVLGPPSSAARTGRDVYFQWAALLGIALDHEAVVESLQARSEDLAGAYRREKELAAEVRASEERYALAATATNDALWDWDESSDTFFYSPRWKSILGYEDGDISGHESEWLDRVHPDDRAALEEELDRTVRADGRFLQSEHRLLAKDGTYRWISCRAAIVRGPDGRAVRLVGSMTDIHERRQLEDRLRQAALHDSLTGLPNRALFNDRLALALARAKRGPGYQFCVVFIDLDGFKVVNDEFGHVAGDALLVQVAERIRAHLREHDTAVRFGGDEFALLLDDVHGPDEIGAIVDRLLARLSAPYDVDGQRLTVSATAGMSLSGSGYEGPEDMVRDADSAMYEAKRRRQAKA